MSIVAIFEYDGIVSMKRPTLLSGFTSFYWMIHIFVLVVYIDSPHFINWSLN